MRSRYALLRGWLPFWRLSLPRLALLGTALSCDTAGGASAHRPGDGIVSLSRCRRAYEPGTVPLGNPSQ